MGGGRWFGNGLAWENGWRGVGEGVERGGNGVGRGPLGTLNSACEALPEQDLENRVKVD